MDVPQARRIERPRWLNARVGLGSVLFLIALVGGQRMISDARSLTPVWVAARDMPAGAVIADGDLVTKDVRLPADVMTAYAGMSTPLVGSTVVEPLSTGEMVPLSAVATAPSMVEGRILTIPLGDIGAVTGDIRVGDRVDILATFDGGEERSATHTIVPAAEVVNVIRSGGFVSEEGIVSGISVRVSASDASRLAFAVRNAEIDLAVVTGQPTQTVPGVISREDFRP